MAAGGGGGEVGPRPVICVTGGTFELEQGAKLIMTRYSSPYYRPRRPRGSKAMALLFLSALDGVGGQRHFPAALPPGKTRYSLYRWLGRPQGWSGRVRKISRSPGFASRTVQAVASRYTD
jgi:hypothetical protein